MNRICPRCGGEHTWLVDNVSNPLDPTFMCGDCGLTFKESEAEIHIETTEQNAKADAGKPKLTLVPRQIIWDICQVREYGNNKYGSPDNWKDVDVQRYRDAAYRHFLAYLDNPKGKDEESGIEHYKHLCCNLAFICEMERWDFNCERSITDEQK